MLVRLNFVALLGTLHALAGRSLEKIDAKAYDAIPLDTPDRLFDVLLRNARIVGGGGLPPYLADVGLSVAPAGPHFTGPSPQVAQGGVLEVGDLTAFVGKTEIDLTGRLLVVAPPGGEEGWKKTLGGLAARGLATADGFLKLPESDLSAEAKAWLGGAAPLAPGYGGDFLVLEPEGAGRFRVERRISPVEP